MSKQQVILQTEEKTHQVFLMLEGEITIRLIECSPLFQMLSPQKARGPAGQFYLLCHYCVALYMNVLRPEF